MKRETPEQQLNYYVATRPPLLSDYSRRSPDQMAHDLNVAHDFIRKLVREKDALRDDLAREGRRLDLEKIWVRICSVGVVAAWGVLGWIVKALLAHGGFFR